MSEDANYQTPGITVTGNYDDRPVNANPQVFPICRNMFCRWRAPHRNPRMILRQRKHAFGPSVCSNNRRNTTRSARRVENLDDAGDELSGNDAEVVASRRDAGARLQIDAGPDEAIEFGDHHPRALVVKF